MKKFKFVLFVAIATFLINGCGGSQYQVIQSSDKFSNNGSYLISTKDNNLVMNPFGNDIVNDVFPTLDIGIMVNKSTNCIKDVSLYLYHPTLYSTGNGIYGSRNATWLNIHKGNRLIFLADGRRVAFTASASKQRTSNDGYNSVSKVVTMKYIDTAVYPASLNKLKQIASAKKLEVRIEGLDHNHDIEANVINENLAKNFRKFYQEQIATRQICR
ncbi:hypothetical protein C9925_00175 [cyanobacterium G8-9]|nr:hypothetical protein C9925_00175 [cyanobacterium G8-9]